MRLQLYIFERSTERQNSKIVVVVIMDVNISQQKFRFVHKTVSYTKSTTVIPFPIQMAMSTPNEGMRHCTSIDAHAAESVFWGIALNLNSTSSLKLNLYFCIEPLKCIFITSDFTLFVSLF